MSRRFDSVIFYIKLGRLAQLVDAEVVPWNIGANVRVGASPASSVKDD